MNDMERKWWANPANEPRVEKREVDPNKEAVRQAARHLVDQYFLHIDEGAFKQGVADRGIVGEVMDALYNKDSSQAQQITREEHIERFSQEHEASPMLIRAILEELQKQHH